MRNYCWPLTAALIFVLLLHINSCNITEIGPCEGEINVINPLPDTTLFINGDSYIRDVSKPPVVFNQTANEPFTLNVSSSGEVGPNGFVVLTEERISEITNRVHVIVVKPNSVGEAKVEVQAIENCADEAGAIDFFNVTVKDTTQ